jgi:hypothetical protein
MRKPIPTPKPKPKSKAKPKGAIIQNKQTKGLYAWARANAMDLPQFQKSMKKEAKADYNASTKALASKKTPTSARKMIQAKRAAAAGTLSVVNARLTKKVSGRKSKRGN